jgi:hypothetical protein
MWGNGVCSDWRRGRAGAVVLSKKRAVVRKHPAVAKTRLRKSRMGRVVRGSLLNRILSRLIRPLLPAVSLVVPTSLLFTRMVHKLSSGRRVLLGQL